MAAFRHLKQKFLLNLVEEEKLAGGARVVIQVMRRERAPDIPSYIPNPSIESIYRMLYHLSWIDVHAVWLLAEELLEKLSVHGPGINVLKKVGMEPFG